MQILIYGATDIGHMIAARLCRDHDITIIDELERVPEKFTNLDISHLTGSAADFEVLEQVNFKKTSIFIACSAIDEANIVACWTIKKITDINTVCFVSKVAIYHNLMADAQHRYQTKFDIDTVIWPERLLTQDIFRIIMVPEAVDVEYFDDGQAKLFEYRIKENSPLSNRRVMDYIFPKEVLIVGITRDNILSIPNGTSKILLGDKIIFMGTAQALDRLAVDLFSAGNSITSAAVIGGGNVGYYLAEQMEQAHIKVKIIELDETRCNFLADNLKKSLVLQGDGTNLELLEDEAIDHADVVVCVTSNDEKNLLCSLLAKQLGAGRIITRTSNERNAELFEKVGVDVVVSPRESAMKELLNMIQSQHIDILALVAKGQGEVLLVTIPESFSDTRVMDLGMPLNTIIGAVKRGKKVIIPNGSSQLSAGDQLTIFTLRENTHAIQAVFNP